MKSIPVIDLPKNIKNIQARLKHITLEVQGIVASSSDSISLKETYNARLTQLWKEFEGRADSLVEVLQQQMRNAEAGAGGFLE